MLAGPPTAVVASPAAPEADGAKSIPASVSRPSGLRYLTANDIGAQDNFHAWWNLNSLKCLGINGGNMTNGTPAVQWECDGSTDQYWSFIPTDGGGYQLYNKANPNKCLGVPADSQENGTQLVIWDCDMSPNQVWVLDNSGYDGCFEIHKYNWEKVIGVSAGSQANGARVIQWSDTGVPDQAWCRVA